MAMNKKEKAEMDRLRQQAALRWTEPVERDLPPPRNGADPVSQGFDFNAYSATVSPAWSGVVYHGSGLHEEKRRLSGSQGSRALYSTEVLALRALRHALENEAAKKLAAVDARIAELTKPAE